MVNRRKKQYAQKFQIYLSPEVDSDKVILEIWKTALQYDRPQTLFRNIIMTGIRTMMENGEMPYSIVSRVKDLKNIMRLHQNTPRNHDPNPYWNTESEDDNKKDHEKNREPEEIHEETEKRIPQTSKKEKEEQAMMGILNMMGQKKGS